MLLLTLVPVKASLNLQKLESDEGYTMINLGTTEIVEEVQTIIHLVKLDGIKEIISKIEYGLGQDGMTFWLKNKIMSINQKIKILNNGRQKRGLINQVGTVGKWLFGSMDNEDRKQIDQHIQNIEKGMDETIQTINEQVHVNDYFNRTLHLLLSTENAIVRKRNDETNTLNEILKEQRRLDAVLKLQILEDKIDILLDNIASIKNGILHPGILLAEEIETFNITIEKLENAKTGIIMTQQNKLFIAINIPVKYKTIPFQLLYPIPDQTLYEIDEAPKYFVKVNGNKYNYHDNKIMYERDLKPLQSCIRYNCNRKLNKNVEITTINDNVILCKNLYQERIVNNCDERELQLTGHYILSINNCSLEIRNTKYKHTSKLFVENQVFEILPDVKLDLLNITNVEEIKRIKQIYLHKNVSIGLNVTLILVITLIVAVLITHVKQKECTIWKVKTHTLPNRKSALSGGGVTLSPPNVERNSLNFAIQ